MHLFNSEGKKCFWIKQMNLQNIVDGEEHVVTGLDKKVYINII